jgi:DNA (cytosine-5)-methyltransferase 1
MKHLGDITKINGAEVEPVEVIIGGSPCQDLSVAGKRAGLDGARSGLFMEQIRIIKEMRENDRATGRSDDAIRPRYMVWENVPGAFSSNKGEDFRIVLEETAKIADPEISIPRPPQGKWTNAGYIMGRGYSIAWRVLDAQFFGVPQRRKRIALVADFGGKTAPEILFERKSVSGNTETSREEGQGVAADVGSGVEETGRSVVYGISAYDSNSMKSGNPNSGIYEAETARTLDLNGGSPACNQGGMAVVSMATKQLSQNVGDNVAMPICANDYKEPQVVCVEGNGSRSSHRGDGYSESETMYTLNSTEHHAVAVENHPADSRVKISEDGKVQTLSSRMGTGGSESLFVGYVVRRLTPMEYERLQGYPDHWTDIGDWTDTKGKKHKAADSPRYKALGNSIAIPCWQFILQGISDRCREHTMASLFAGIGGFELCSLQVGIKPIWNSEVEEYCIAVTKKHFGNGDEKGDYEQYL